MFYLPLKFANFEKGLWKYINTVSFVMFIGFQK